MKAVLNSFSCLGLREAERGEFSKRFILKGLVTLFNYYRALLNGKMTLTEIEGLSDLLEAETELQLKISQHSTNVFQHIYVSNLNF